MHVLGLKAEVIDEPVRIHVQLMVAFLQLILIATRGHRAYTSPELVSIFEDAGGQFFSHMEKVAQHIETRRIRRGQRRHDSNPDRNPAPTPFRKTPRFVSVRLTLCTHNSYTCIYARI